MAALPSTRKLQTLMRFTLTIVSILTAVQASAAEMTQDERNARTLHGLITFYAAGTVCYYNKRSFSKQEVDEMLSRIAVLRPSVDKSAYDTSWKRAQDIMAEGQGMATVERCAMVHDQYAKGRPFLLGLQSK